MQVIGICRFSWPGEGGFQVQHRDLDARISYLYDRARLEERFRTFETITLPPLRAQSDANFTFLIVIGETLPEEWLSRLMDLVADIPQAIILPKGPGRHREVMQEAINQSREFDNQPCLQFRMDDDDAVACTYIETLRGVVRDIGDLAQKHRCMAIDFSQGYIARPGPMGLEATPTNAPFTTAALALIISPKDRRTVMNFAHHKVARNMPTLSFCKPDMLIRGHNDFNDSRQKAGVKPVELTPLTPEQEDHFRRVFNIDADHVRRVFSAP